MFQGVQEGRAAYNDELTGAGVVVYVLLCGRSPYAKPANGTKAPVEGKRAAGGPVALRSQMSIGTQMAGAMTRLDIVSARTRVPRNTRRDPDERSLPVQAHEDCQVQGPGLR